ncbi:MAG: CCA tRNA nucleotidyltransferase [Pseudomonadota bacterium]
MTVITAEWLRDAATQRVMRALDERAYFVGGCVRNTLLKQPVSDIDLATPLLPEQVVAALDARGIRSVPTGIAHGTITAISDGRPFEITTFRRDVETDGRHAIVAFSTDLHTDAARRDFTLNALYADCDGTLIDPMNGLPDLRAGKVRFILDPAERIMEDALRILRFFRFTAWYGSETDREGLAACAEYAEQVESLARERVGAEFRKLLQAPDPAPAVASMAYANVLPRCLPGANPHALAPLMVREAEAGLAADWQVRLAALGAEDADDRLRLSKSEARYQSEMRHLLDSPLPPAIAASEFGAEFSTAAQVISTSGLDVDWAAVTDEIKRGSQAKFPVSANDLLRLGVRPGPELGSALRVAREAWHASDLLAGKETLLENLAVRGMLG